MKVVFVNFIFFVIGVTILKSNFEIDTSNTYDFVLWALGVLLINLGGSISQLFARKENSN